MTRLLAEGAQDATIYVGDVGTLVILDCEEPITDFEFFEFLMRAPRSQTVRTLPAQRHSDTSLCRTMDAQDLAPGPGEYLIHGRLRTSGGLTLHTDMVTLTVLPLWKKKI